MINMLLDGMDCVIDILFMENLMCLMCVLIVSIVSRFDCYTLYNERSYCLEACITHALFFKLLVFFRCSTKHYIMHHDAKAFLWQHFYTFVLISFLCSIHFMAYII